MITATMSGRSMTVFVDFVPYTIDDTHPNFGKVKDLLFTRKPEDINKEELVSLISLPTFIKKNWKSGDIDVRDGKVYYKGVEIHGYHVDKLLEMLRDGVDPTPIARFIERLMLNPRRSIVTELYQWLEKAEMPLREDGFIIAYKKVNEDYTSIWDGKTRNDIGTTVSLSGYNDVDDNRENVCSRGLHFCSWHYLPHYGCDDGSRVVVLAIDPADVVSIPVDYDHSKGRAWRYQVIGEVPREKAEHAFRGVHVVPVDGDLSIEAWTQAVMNGETTLGYNEWVEMMKEEDEDEDEDRDELHEAWIEEVSLGETTLGFDEWLQNRF